MAIDRASIPLESEITKKIQRYLSGLDGWWGFKVQGGGQQKRGVPDIVGCYNGRFVAFEVKRPHVGQLSDLQEHVIGQIKAVEGHAFVVRSVDEVKQIILSFAARMNGTPTGAGD